jgi:hypothetical protein
LAISAAKQGDTKTARHHGGHAFSALNDRVSGSGFAGSPMQPKGPTTPKPLATPPTIEGGEQDDADVVPVQTGGGLMARLRAFGGKSNPVS